MNDYIKRSMGILIAVCLTAFVPACSGSKTVSSSSGKKPTVSVASSRLSSSGSSSSPVSSAVTSAVSSTVDSSIGTAATQHTGGKPAGTTGKSTGRTTGGGVAGKAAGNGGTITGRGAGGGTTGGTGGYTPAPAPQGFSTQYYGANYGCTDASQYSYVLSKARSIENTSAYQSTYNAYAANPEDFQDDYGIPYSAAADEAVSIAAACGGGGRGNGSTGSAYSYFTGANSMCGDHAKAIEACLHCHGFNARLCWGNGHMWTRVSVQGHSLDLGNNGSSESGEGYNYG